MASELALPTGATPTQEAEVGDHMGGLAAAQSKAQPPLLLSSSTSAAAAPDKYVRLTNLSPDEKQRRLFDLQLSLEQKQRRLLVNVLKTQASHLRNLILSHADLSSPKKRRSLSKRLKRTAEESEITLASDVARGYLQGLDRVDHLLNADLTENSSCDESDDDTTMMPKTSVSDFVVKRFYAGRAAMASRWDWLVAKQRMVDAELRTLDEKIEQLDQPVQLPISDIIEAGGDSSPALAVECARCLPYQASKKRRRFVAFERPPDMENLFAVKFCDRIAEFAPTFHAVLSTPAEMPISGRLLRKSNRFRSRIASFVASENMKRTFTVDDMVLADSSGVGKSEDTALDCVNVESENVELGSGSTLVQVLQYPGCSLFRKSQYTGGESPSSSSGSSSESEDSSSDSNDRNSDSASSKGGSSSDYFDGDDGSNASASSPELHARTRRATAAAAALSASTAAGSGHHSHSHQHQHHRHSHSHSHAHSHHRRHHSDTSLTFAQSPVSASATPQPHPALSSPASSTPPIAPPSIATPPQVTPPTHIPAAVPVPTPMPTFGPVNPPTVNTPSQSSAASVTDSALRSATLLAAAALGDAPVLDSSLTSSIMSSLNHRRRLDTWDFDNVVVPTSIATSRIEPLQYKEIEIPAFRASDGVAPVVFSPAASTDMEVDEAVSEDESLLTDEVFLKRHEPLGVAERQRFYQFSGSMGGGRRHENRHDSLEDNASSGSRTPSHSHRRNESMSTSFSTLPSSFMNENPHLLKQLSFSFEPGFPARAFPMNDEQFQEALRLQRQEEMRRGLIVSEWIRYQQLVLQQQLQAAELQKHHASQVTAKRKANELSPSSAGTSTPQHTGLGIGGSPSTPRLSSSLKSPLQQPVMVVPATVAAGESNVWKIEPVDEGITKLKLVFKKLQ